MTELELAKPLDPIYASPKDVPSPGHEAERYNKWRSRLPEHCWLCNNFDRCSPGHKCRRQVDIDVQAQHGLKHEGPG